MTSYSWTTGLAAGFLALIASVSVAQARTVSRVSEESESQSLVAAVREDSSVSSRGVRVSLFKPFLAAEVELSSGGQSASLTGTVNPSLGLSLGYVSLPVGSLGWGTNVAYIDISSTNSRSSIGLGRIDGNLGYAFNEIWNWKGGLNFSKFVSGELKELEGSFGLQTSVGAQFTRNFGIDLGLVSMSQSKSIEGAKVDLREAGLELGLNATF